ncbi:MAG TPA: putative selenate reductase subunit YgfK [Spirochaetia bacterium]|nr:putative selenate reductase subunit YgfK [Spirochaetia bacterium]
MSDKMRLIPFRNLLQRCMAEFKAKDSIFDIPSQHFWTPRAANVAQIFSASAPVNPVGPAAGPHTQLAQNIISSWLAGGRYFELKTVQKLDSLAIEKPCIDAADEGYNVEWSTELSLDQAFDEYLKAWMALHALSAIMNRGQPDSFIFNMSVGYDLAGIKTEKMDQFINRLIDSGAEPLFRRYREELAVVLSDRGLLEGTPWAGRAAQLRDLPGRIPGTVCASVTLSTMHGCPPGEIESICAYMLTEKKLDTLVKLNPTLLGHERARDILADLGYSYVQLNPEGFRKDLQYADAVPMLTRLLALGRGHGRHFGAKLSNTLAAANQRGVLPGAEMYLSGRALYPLTITLADSLAREFQGGLPLSFSGGAASWNVAAILDAGIRPVTLATDLLKPGGYSRLKEIAEISEAHAASWKKDAVDPVRTHEAAQAARVAEPVRKEFRGSSRVGVRGPLPTFDCFVAPCTTTCPIQQDVPEYVHLAGAGKMGEAFRAVFLRNPLPFMTGYLCDHACMGNCTRMDWEGSVEIREMKKVAAERGYEEFRKSGLHRSASAASRGIKAAVVGAGPAGLAAASFLCREGFEVHVFEREKEPGGIVRYLLPGFRIPVGAIEKDVTLLSDLGAHLHFGEDHRTVEDLRSAGFRYIVAGVGAEARRDAGIPGARDALSFLREFRRDPSRVRLGRTVAVIGAGDTAMDAARAATRCPGVAEVRVVYRRTENEMPASHEEYRDARAEGISFHFLRSPVSWTEKTGLLCSVMELGPEDQSGRARPVATSATELLPADSVIAALGADVDTAALASIGVAGAVNAETQETAPGVFLVGDAAEGAATIVRAIASARRAVEAIAAREGGSRFKGWPLPPEDVKALRAARDRRITTVRDSAAFAATESSRCLGCRALCVKCVEVCPNRANTVVKVPGLRDPYQIVHIDAFCNECGNCATFCPWEGRPYKDKLTVFDTEADFLDSTNPGFFLEGAAGGPAAGRIRVGGRVGKIERDAAGAVTAEIGDAATLAVVQAVVKDHSWLVGGTR